MLPCCPGAKSGSQNSRNWLDGSVVMWMCLGGLCWDAVRKLGDLC